MLSTKHPINFLFNQQSMSDQEQCRLSSNTLSIHTQATVNKGATVILVPICPNELMATFVLDEDVPGSIALGYLNKELPNTRMLLPGYGVCEVAENDIKEIESPSLRNNQGISSGVTSLSLQIDVTCKSTFLDLIDVIGASLTRLTLTYEEEDTDGDLVEPLVRPLVDIARILRSCSRLSALSFVGFVIDSEVFLLTIEELGMRISELRCSFTNRRRISTELSNPASRLARHLKSFTYRYRYCGPEETPEADAVAIPEILPYNSTLQSICFIASDEVQKVMCNVAMEEDERELPCPREPFPLECRLAFLSIFGPISEEKQPIQDSAPVRYQLEYPRLDQDTLSAIFSFAAEPLCRRVRVQSLDE